MESGVSWEAQYAIGRYITDFFIEPLKLVVECDGDYWHQRPGEPENDAKRDAYMRTRGYDTLRLSEKSIKTDEAKNILMAVLKARSDLAS